MSLISLLSPAFISLVIYLNFLSHRRDLLKDISYYFICNIIINLIVLGTVHYIFGHEEVTWTLVFTIKYLLMASVLAIVLPFVINLLLKLINKLFPSIEATINTGVKKDGKFSFKMFYRKNKILSNNIIFIGSGALLFYILDIVIRLTAIKASNFGGDVFIAPFLFTLAYYGLFLLLQCYLPKILARILSIIVYILYIGLFVANYMLLQIKDEALSVGELTNAGEGFKFLNFLVQELSFVFIITIILAIALAVINFKFLGKIKTKKRFKYFAIAVIAIVASYFLAVILLPRNKDPWLQISKARYYYDNFINPKRSLAVLGMYEYTYRDVHLSIKSKFDNYGSIKEIETAINKHAVQREDNAYTGVFKDKNLIMIMLESIDYYIVDDQYMPTMSKLMDESWVFPGRFSALSSGGSTITTEFTSQTGLIYDTNFFNDIFENYYSYSIANMFNDAGYITSSMHENSGTYYNRQKLHPLLGFENSYFLIDIDSHIPQYTDAQIVDNEDFYNKIVPKDKDRFMSLIVTISAHGPFDTTNPICKRENKISSDHECFGYLANRTDILFDHLLTKLEEDGLLDDTVIVLYTDHPSYSYNYPEDYLNTLPPVDENHKIKAIPFLIYSKGMEPKKFDDLLVNDIDLPPTLLNMFGIDYDPKNYLGVDLFSKDHRNLSIFTDTSWYDGVTYSANPNVVATNSSYKENTEYAQDIINLNKMILSNGYYNKSTRKK